MLTYKEISHEDPQTIEHFRQVKEAVVAHDLPGFVVFTHRQLLLMQKHPRPGHKAEAYVALEDGEPVGALELFMPTLDNLKNVFFNLEVIPAYRRRGIGTRLFELLQERTKAAGRTTILTGTGWTLPGLEAHDGGAGPAFAEAMGFESANLPEILRRLDLSTLDNAVLDDMFAKAQAVSEGYRLVQWGNRAPDELVDDIAYLDGRMIQDAPMGDLAIEQENVDAQRVRNYEESATLRGRVVFNTGAVHEESGRLVAWTCIATDPEVGWHAWQNITIVDPSHRGRRLGALVKVANLRYMQEGAPAVRKVDTGNAAVNSYMIAINVQMGFEPKWAMQNWQREV